MVYKKSFTLSEVFITLGIIGIIIVMTVGAIYSNRQKGFDAKYNKIASIISANIQQDIANHTGFRYANYAGNPSAFQNAVLENLNVAESNCNINTCWSASRNFNIDANGVLSDANGAGNLTMDANWRYVRLNDGIVLAFQNDNTNIDTSTRIMIDVNGRRKGPSRAQKDIRLYNAPLRNQLGLQNGGSTIWVNKPQKGCPVVSPPVDNYIYARNPYPDCGYYRTGCDVSKGAFMFSEGICHLKNKTNVPMNWKEVFNDDIDDDNDAQLYCINSNYCTHIGSTKLGDGTNSIDINRFVVTAGSKTKVDCTTSVVPSSMGALTCKFTEISDSTTISVPKDTSYVETCMINNSCVRSDSNPSCICYDWGNDEISKYLYNTSVCVWLYEKNLLTPHNESTNPAYRTCMPYLNNYGK